jgi:hypothetical protein
MRHDTAAPEALLPVGEIVKIDALVDEGRALEVTIRNYAKRVSEVTARIGTLAESLPGHDENALHDWSGYSDLWAVVDDLVTHLQAAIDGRASHANHSIATKETTHA